MCSRHELSHPHEQWLEFTGKKAVLLINRVLMQIHSMVVACVVTGSSDSHKQKNRQEYLP